MTYTCETGNICLWKDDSVIGTWAKIQSDVIFKRDTFTRNNDDTFSIEMIFNGETHKVNVKGVIKDRLIKTFATMSQAKNFRIFALLKKYKDSNTLYFNTHQFICLDDFTPKEMEYQRIIQAKKKQQRQSLRLKSYHLSKSHSKKQKVQLG